MKWVVAVLVFLFCVAGMEIYRSTELVRASYAVQKLQGIWKQLEKDNGHLKQKLSSSLSLTGLESRARGTLGLRSPRETRFITEDLRSPDERPVSFWLRAWNRVNQFISKFREVLS